MILRDMVYERLEKNRSSCKHHHPEGEPCAIDIINGTFHIAAMLLVIADKIRINDNLDTTPEVMELPVSDVTNKKGQDFTISVVVRKGSTPPCVLADGQSKSLEDFKEVMGDYGIDFGDDKDEEQKPTAPTEQKDEVIDNVDNHIQGGALTAYKNIGTKHIAELFSDAVKRGEITKDDGEGYWGTDLGYSNIDCFDEKPEWATHVAWFNNN